MGVPKKRTSSVTIMRYYYVNRCECLFGKWATFTVREARHNMSLFMCPLYGGEISMRMNVYFFHFQFN